MASRRQEWVFTDLPKSDHVYTNVSFNLKQDIESRGHRINILNIEVLKHARLEGNYERCKAAIACTTDPNERLLYHGSIDSHLIAEMGFDINLASPNGLFGPGLYFADDACKSAGYADGMVFPPKGRSKMLLCYVILGREYKIDYFKKFHQPPQGYNSVHGVRVGLTSQKYDEYIVYDEDQTLPRIVVTYDIQ